MMTMKNFTKLIAMSTVALAVCSMTAAASAQVVGPPDLPDWEGDAQIKLGWTFDTPTTPESATPLTDWDVCPGTVPSWAYDADLEMWDQPAQWYLPLENVDEPGDKMNFMVSWVYSYVGDHEFYTNLSWDPFDDYENMTGAGELFDSEGTLTTDTGSAAYGRFTQSVDMLPDPETIDVYLGVDPAATGMELVECYILAGTAAGDTDTDSDTDADTDSDSDADTDTDSDTDSDADADSGGGDDGGCSVTAAGTNSGPGLVALLASLL